MIEFRHPLVLAVFPLLAVLAIFLTRRPIRIFPLLLRLILLFAPLLALAGPGRMEDRETPPHLVCLVDVSESVPAEDVEKALDRIPRGSEILLFAGHQEPFRDRSLALHRRTEAERRQTAEEGNPAPLEEILAWKENMGTDRTDIDSAIDAARSFYLPGRNNSIALFSDGRSIEPRRTSLDDVFYVPLSTAPPRDLALLGARAPFAVPYGAPFDLVVDVFATVPSRIRLSVTVDHRPLASVEKDVEAGRSLVPLPPLQQQVPFAQGVRELRVYARCEGDTEPRNNSTYAAVEICGRPRILLVEGNPAEGEFLARVLAAQEMEVVRIPLDRFRIGPEGGRTDAIVLAGIGAEALPSSSIESLESYVTGGGGLLWIPSRETARRNPPGSAALERLLPVVFEDRNGGSSSTGNDPPVSPSSSGDGGETRRVRAPRVALLLVIDKSGSMAAGNNLKLAREACLQAAEALSGGDAVAILGFDARPQWISEFSSADHLETLQDRIQRLFAGGGTNIHAALEEAARIMASNDLAPFGIRHIVLLSDGETPAADFASTIGRIRTAGVTLSSICIASGEDFDSELMRSIAESGGGRYLFTDSFQNLPKLFVEEIERVLGESVSSRPAPPQRPDVPPDPAPSPPSSGRTAFPVRVRDSHEILRGIDLKAPPPLPSLVPSRARPSTLVPLESEPDLPALAIGRFGLGKTSAWLSDLSGGAWTSWAGTPQLFVQLVRHLAGPAEVPGLAHRLDLEPKGPAILLHVSGSDPVETVSGPEFERGPEGWSGRIVPGRTGAPVPVSLVSSRGDRVERLHTAVQRDYDPEYDPRVTDGVRGGISESRLLPLDRVRSFAPPGGTERSRRDLTGAFLLAALLLLPLDAFVRRNRITRS